MLYSIQEVKFEIVLEAHVEGSFRAVVKKVEKGFPGFLADGIKNLFWAAVAMAFLEPIFSEKQDIHITVNDDEVIVQTGDDHTSVVIPRNFYEVRPNLSKSEEVKRRVRRTYQVISRNDDIDAFGFSPSLESESGMVTIWKDDIDRIARTPLLTTEPSQKTKVREEIARLVIVKAWLNHAHRKWLFEWNGVPVSAPIKDDDFLDRLTAREYPIGSGDALDVVLTWKQNYVESLGVYENDPNSYVVKEVVKPVPRVMQPKLPGHP